VRTYTKSERIVRDDPYEGMNVVEVTNATELAAALTNEDVEVIDLGSAVVDGFIVSRDVIITGGTIVPATLSGEPRPTAIYVTNGANVTIDGVSFDGEETTLTQGILTPYGVPTVVNVYNSTFIDIYMGIYFNPGATGEIVGNTFENIDYAAIGLDTGSGEVYVAENTITTAVVGIEIFGTNVTYENNTFIDCDTEIASH
jgi:hypothetical protein